MSLLDIDLMGVIIFNMSNVDNNLEKLVREVGKDFGYHDLELELGTNSGFYTGRLEYFEIFDDKLKLKMHLDTSRPREKIVSTIAHEFGHVKSEEIYPYLSKLRKLREYWGISHVVGLFASWFSRSPFPLVATICVDILLLMIQERLAEREARRRGYRR